MLKFDCPKCGKHLSAPDEAAGRKGTCPGCGGAVCAPTQPAATQPEPDIPYAEVASEAAPVNAIDKTTVEQVRSSRKESANPLLGRLSEAGMRRYYAIRRSDSSRKECAKARGSTRRLDASLRNESANRALGCIGDPRLGCVAQVVYLVYGFVQLLLIVKGVQVWFKISGILSVLLSLIIAYIPIVGPIAGIKGAMAFWGWSLWGAIAFFCWPYVLYLWAAIAREFGRE